MSYATLLTGHWPAVEGNLSDVHTVAKQPIGTIMMGLDDLGSSCWYMYVPGVANGAIGFAVTFDLYGAGTPAVAALAANAKGPICVMKAALVAATFGWAALTGTHQVLTAANCAV